jgi:hypothetical protein
MDYGPGPSGHHSIDNFAFLVRMAKTGDNGADNAGGLRRQTILGGR